MSTDVKVLNERLANGIQQGEEKDRTADRRAYARVCGWPGLRDRKSVV